MTTVAHAQNLRSTLTPLYFSFSVFPVPNNSSSVLANFLLLWQNTMARINLKEKVYFDLWFQRVESIIVGTTQQQAAGVGNWPITFSQHIRKQSVLEVELDHKLAKPISSALLPQQACTPKSSVTSQIVSCPGGDIFKYTGPVGEHFLFKLQVFPKHFRRPRTSIFAAISLKLLLLALYSATYLCFQPKFQTFTTAARDLMMSLSSLKTISLLFPKGQNPKGGPWLLHKLSWWYSSFYFVTQLL